MGNVTNKELFTEPKAIRTVEKSEFKGLKTTVQEETVFMAKPISKVEKKAAPQRSTVKTTATDVSFKVVPAEDAPHNESYGGRGGGGGGRGGGRGGDRKYSPRTSAGGGFDLTADLFPSL